MLKPIRETSPFFRECIVFTFPSSREPELKVSSSGSHERIQYSFRRAYYRIMWNKARRPACHLPKVLII